jgi:hypothetical protein
MYLRTSTNRPVPAILQDVLIKGSPFACRNVPKSAGSSICGEYSKSHMDVRGRHCVCKDLVKVGWSRFDDELLKEIGSRGAEEMFNIVSYHGDYRYYPGARHDGRISNVSGEWT